MCTRALREIHTPHRQKPAGAEFLLTCGWRRLSPVGAAQVQPVHSGYTLLHLLVVALLAFLIGHFSSVALPFMSKVH